MNGHLMRTYFIYNYTMPICDLSNTESVYLPLFILALCAIRIKRILGPVYDNEKENWRY